MRLGPPILTALSLSLSLTQPLALMVAATRRARPLCAAGKEVASKAIVAKPKAAAKKAAADSSVTKPKAAAKSRAKASSPAAASLLLEPPAGWRATYDLIVELRADRTAVVDTMGSEALSELCASAAEMEYQTLVSLMLSSQTKDTVNAATMVSAAPTLNPGPRTLSPSPGPEP